MEIDRILDHLESRDIALAVVARMRLIHIWEIERSIDFLLSHWWVLGVEYNDAVATLLSESCGMFAVGLFLDVLEIFGIAHLVVETLFVRIEFDSLPVFILRKRRVGRDEKRRLRNRLERAKRDALAEESTDFGKWFFTHAIDENVGTGIDKDRWSETILPIVVVSDTTERSLDASEKYRYVGEEHLENLCVDDRRIVGTGAGASARSICIIGTSTSGSSIMVDHGIHGSGRYCKEIARSSEFAEIAKVVLPIRLRHNGNLESARLDDTSDDSGAE